MTATCRSSRTTPQSRLMVASLRPASDKRRPLEGFHDVSYRRPGNKRDASAGFSLNASRTLPWTPRVLAAWSPRRRPFHHSLPKIVKRFFFFSEMFSHVQVWNPLLYNRRRFIVRNYLVAQRRLFPGELPPYFYKYLSVHVTERFADCARWRHRPVVVIYRSNSDATMMPRTRVNE